MPIGSFSTLDAKAKENQYQKIMEKVNTDQAMVDRYFKDEPISKIAEDSGVTVEYVTNLIKAFVGTDFVPENPTPKAESKKPVVTNDIFAAAYIAKNGDRKAICKEFRMTNGSYDYHVKKAEAEGKIVVKTKRGRPFKKDQTKVDTPPTVKTPAPIAEAPVVEDPMDTPAETPTEMPDSKENFHVVMENALAAMMGAASIFKLEKELEKKQQIHSKSMEIIGEYVLENVLLKEELMKSSK